MPTGFTAPVGDGEMTTLQEFATSCAHAFGAFVHQRDDGVASALRYPNPSTFYSTMYMEAKEARAEWESLSEEERYAKWSVYHRDTLLDNARTIGQKRATRARYEAMLAQVESVDVPSDLDNFKDFMISQLEDSIGFDCNERYLSPPLDYVSWCDTQDEQTRRNSERYREEMEMERERYNQRVSYISKLVETYGIEVVR